MNKFGAFIPMSICLKNLFDCAVWIIPAVAGFIAVGKTRRIVREVSDSFFLFYDRGGLQLFFEQSSLCFSFGNKIPCLVRKQADVSDPLISS